ncbi:unnamed protein product [Darwinula stevensoni]|uniref:sn-1-specific diacylglycerol lipase ABHD11 n=1 Tax=Darwinula stevensoni TaxID=69355 RepID=A0A7R9AAC6_9CRUS|nr:unnamed protein product [Darwinula stevensoni]CAG0898257.1 unnamed protein product [Darwinula stevensoni]
MLGMKGCPRSIHKFMSLLPVRHKPSSIPGPGPALLSTSSDSQHQTIKDPGGQGAVKLAFSSYEDTRWSLSPSEQKAPVIIMHGLLGSRSNWNSLAKMIHRRTKRKIITVDARNHGESPHTEEMTYEAMARDVECLMDDLGINQASLVGHSMGGRAMMALALTKPKLLESLFVVDVSPLSQRTSTLLAIPKFLETMQNIHIENHNSLALARKEADRQLASVAPDPMIRSFLLTNLVIEDGAVRWRVNLNTLIRTFMPHLASFPKFTSTFDGPTYFIGGTNSDYLRREDHEGIRELFPNAEFHYVEGAGHWVHSDKPQDFLDLICPLLQGRSYIPPKPSH